MGLKSVADDAQLTVIKEIVQQIVDRLSPSLPAASTDDPQLAIIIRAWPLLPATMRTAILSLVNAVGDRTSGS
jgi:hypothetical protein